MILCIIDKRNPIYPFEQIVEGQSDPDSDDSSGSARVVIKPSLAVDEDSDEDDVNISPPLAFDEDSDEDDVIISPPLAVNQDSDEDSVIISPPTAKPGQKRKIGQSSIKDFFFKKKK